MGCSIITCLSTPSTSAQWQKGAKKDDFHDEISPKLTRGVPAARKELQSQPPSPVLMLPIRSWQGCSATTPLPKPQSCLPKLLSLALELGNEGTGSPNGLGTRALWDPPAPRPLRPPSSQLHVGSLAFGGSSFVFDPLGLHQKARSPVLQPENPKARR